MNEITEKKLTQTEKIKNDLENGFWINPINALKEYGCFRLAARINDIKNMGFDVQSKTVYNLNKDGDKIHYSEYWLED